ERERSRAKTRSAPCRQGERESGARSRHRHLATRSAGTRTANCTNRSRPWVKDPRDTNCPRRFPVSLPLCYISHHELRAPSIDCRVRATEHGQPPRRHSECRLPIYGCGSCNRSDVGSRKVNGGHCGAPSRRDRYSPLSDQSHSGQMLRDATSRTRGVAQPILISILDQRIEDSIGYVTVAHHWRRSVSAEAKPVIPFGSSPPHFMDATPMLCARFGPREPSTLAQAHIPYGRCIDRQVQ